MKNFNLIKRLWTDSHEKQSPQRFARYAAILIMLLTLGVGQMWADDKGFYEVYMVYDKNGTEYSYTYNGSNGSMDLGTITSSFKIKKMYLKVWDDWGDQAFEAGKSGLGYKTQSGSDTDYKANTRSSDSDHDYELQHTSMNLTIASNTNPSGNYTFTHWWFAGGTWTSTYYLKNGSSNCAFTYKIAPPAVKSGTVSISATNTAPGSGTGLSSGSPIILISGMASTLTITATPNHTDANSALWCKFGDNSYSSTTTYNIASGTTTSNQTIALAVKYRNNSARLDGAETATTIYYKWAAPAPAIVLTSVTPSTSIVAGNDITLVGTRANSSNTISFQYTTNDGGSWTDITPKSSSLSSNTLTAVWTVPDAHGANQTFKFRAKLAEASPIYSSKSDGVTVYNTKTIHVKNSNNWGTMYVYAWDGSGAITSSWHGNTGNTQTGGFSCTSAGGQWWDVVITSRTTGFILNGGGSGDANQTVDLYYSTYTHDRCLAIGTEADKKSLSNTAATCPSAPSVTTAAATSVGATSVQFNASSVSANNDAITAYGFKWGTTSACDDGTVTASNLSSTTFSATKNSLTNGTTYYFKAYATNGQGTTYGDPVSVRTKFITTVTLNPQGGEGGTTEVTATEGSSMPTGKVAPTKWGYDFGGYYALAGGSGTKYYNANMSSANNWDVAASTATIHALWTAKSCTISLNNQGADSGKEGTTSVSTTYNTNTNLTSDITCPTKTGWKFQGYWSNTNGNGVQVIAADGSWISTVSGYMYEGKWVADGSATLYAYWVNASTYTFRYGTSGSEDWNGTAFTQVDATTTWQIENFTIPNKPNFYVGYEGLFYESSLGTGATKSKSVTRAWTDAPAEVSGTYQGQMVLLPAGPTAGAIGQATGATGTLKIYSDSKHHNLYVGFEPSGYGVTCASGTLPFVNSSGTWRETNVVTLTSSDASGTFQVKLKTSSSYVATAHGTAENASAVNGRKITGDADIANGKKGVFQMWTDATSNNFGLRFVTVHDVTFNMQGHGSAISKYTDVRYNSKISAPSAPSQTGYTFGGWYKEEGCTNAWNFGSDVVTAATTLYAKWTPNTYTVTLDQQSSAEGYSADGDDDLTATFDAAFPLAAMPTAANGYAFMGYWSAAGGTGTQFTDDSGNLLANIDSYSDASGNWIYAGDDLTLYAYYKKAEITALGLSKTVIAPNETITVTPTIEPTPVGPTKVCYELQYSNGTRLPSQPTFTPVAGNAVSFPVPSASATYIIQAKLAKGSDCPANPEDVLSTRTTTFQVAGEHTVTIRYQDSDGRTLQASASVEVRPLEWTTLGDITPPTITGYTFARWDAGDGVSIKNGASDPITTTTTPSIQIKANYDGTLTAVYNKKKMVYFNNTLNWDTVYVYFYNNASNNKYWADGYGTGANKNQEFSGNKPFWEMHYGGMKRVAPGSNIWYFDWVAEGWSESEISSNITFANVKQALNVASGDNSKDYFHNAKVVFRQDYNNRTSLPMFVPLTSESNDFTSTTGSKYYSNGYWMNYPENTGYSLLIYNQKAKAGATKLYEIPFEFTEDFTMPMELVVDLEAGKTYGFEIKRADSKYYSNAGTMTTNTTNRSMSENQSSYCGLQTTAAGNYTFRFYYSSSDYRMDVTYPVAANDYRIVYTDVATWSKDVHTASWNHPSRVITKNSSATETKKDTVSFFWSYGSTPAIKYQKCTGTGAGSVTWNAGTSIDVSGFSSVLTKKGVYNFIFEQPAGGASILLVGVEPYTGNYYIRTDCAGSTKWANFSSMDHQMTYSDYAEVNSGYSHYYTHWVTNGTNVKFCIANDYSMCITDTLVEDKGTVIANITAEGNDGAGRLNSASANIRFMWDQATNKISRAYIGGSTNISERFLVLEGDAKMFDENGNPLNITGLNPNEANLIDDQNFVYERTIQVNTKARAKLTAKYNNNIQYFKGSEGAFAEGTTIELLGGDADGKHTMRIVYDFKTNRLVTAYVPSGTINAAIAINADLMIVREHQGAGQQLLFEGAGALSKVHTVYGVMRFNRWTLNNKEKTGAHSPVGDPKSIYERSLYWISFPFNVNLSDVFGFGTYGVDWIIEYYDGAERAANGYWIDSDGFWKMVMPAQRANFTLEAGKGYVLAIDVDVMKDNNTTFWANNIEQVELFFPSATNVENISQTTAHTIVPEHECTIDRRTDKSEYNINKDRTKADSHWNMIGVPSYANYGETLTSDEAGTQTITWNSDPYTNDLPFLYEWNMTDDSYTVQSGDTYPFKAMHAYMVQYHGDLYWSLASATPTPSPIVARRAYAEKPQNAEFRLELQQNEKMVDQTFVNMKDAEEISAGFKFDEDLCKEFNAGKANIYTLIENYLPAAGNTLPMSEQTTLVPVGVKTTAAGEYTFAMPEGTSGVSVVLIDNIAGTRTNLALSDYTVTLSKGDLSDRFMLEIAPIKQMPTDIENVQGDNVHSTKVRKVMIDGILYIVKDGKVFDARGAKVK